MESPSERLLNVFREFGGEALRDVWIFDERAFERVYVRPDVAEAIDDGGLDVERFVDNERYGFVTRQTYESLYYADYGYTVRGLSTFEQFRTFFRDEPIGVFGSFDLSEDGYDYRRLDESIQELARELGPEAFAPETDVPDVPDPTDADSDPDDSSETT